MWVANPAEELWTGSEESIRAAQTLANKINAADPKAFFGDSAPEAPSLLEKDGNVGVIRVQGQLFASVPDWAKAAFGVSDYNDISSALVKAATDPDIGAIVLDVDSPGGAVSGVDAVANLVTRIDRQVKPVHAVAGGTMASAAYWISAGARKIDAGPLSNVGSIGVLIAHSEYSKQMEQEGVTTTVLRAGRYKALGNPYEPLSDVARAEIQGKLDYTYKIFMGHVADSRGMPYEVANSRMGEGRVFMGELAQAAGLVDSVQTFEQSLTEAQELAAKSVDTRKSLIQNPKKQKEGSPVMGKKATLTEADIAALASGAAIDAAAPQAPAAVEEPHAAAEIPVEEPAAEAPVAAAAEPVAAAAVIDQSAVVSLLERQLHDAQEAVLATRVQLAKVEDQASELRAAQDPLLAIARSAIQKMCIALGTSGDHVATLAGPALLEEHAKVSEVFQSRFKVGGVAAASAQAKADETKPQVSYIERARIQAVRLANK